MGTRAPARFLILLLASFGPLAPIMLLFLLAMPPLIALSGWPWWLDLGLALAECGLVDPLFPVFTSHARYEIRLMGKDQYPLMRVALLTGEPGGTRLGTIAAERVARMQ